MPIARSHLRAPTHYPRAGTEQLQNAEQLQSAAQALGLELEICVRCSALPLTGQRQLGADRFEPQFTLLLMKRDSVCPACLRAL